MAVTSEEQRHVTGTSMGGRHSRQVHLPLFNSSPRKPEKLNPDVKMETGSSNSDSGDSDHNCNYYGLRENPKRNCKFSDSGTGVSISCQECGKLFDTERALFGHMRLHSVKKKSSSSTNEMALFECKKCGEGFGSVRAMSGHMKVHSRKSSFRDQDDDCGDKVLDLDSLCPVRRKRSRVLYQNVLHCSSFSSFNESSSVGAVASDVEMAAASLIMLSKGLRDDDVRVDSVTKSSSGDSSDYYGGGVCSDSETSPSTRLVGFRGVKREFGKPDELGSKFAAEMTMKVGFGVSDELMCNVGGVSGDGMDCDPDLKSFDSMKFTGADKDVDMDETPSQFLKSKSFTKPPSDSVRSSAENAVGRVDYTSNDSGTKHTYKHRSSMNVKASLLCDDELAIKESGTVRLDSIKRKEFKCLACFKVFSSGQALGGHKRAHFTRPSTVNRTGEATNADHQEVGGVFDLESPVSVLEA